MSDSRENSPDWLRDFQAPTRNLVTLSSASESSPETSLRSSDDVGNENLGGLQKKKDSILIDSEDDKPISKLRERKSPKDAKKHTLKEEPLNDELKPQEKRDFMLIDSEDDKPICKINRRKSPKNPKKSAPKEETPPLTYQRRHMDISHEESEAPDKSNSVLFEMKDAKHTSEEDMLDSEVVLEDITEKPAVQPVSSRLPLMFPDKVQRLKALVECEGDSIDLSGDVGAVGRVVITESLSGNAEMLLDLKGTIYKSTIVPSRTFCIVSVGQSEAKVEAIMNDFIRLEPQSNVFEAETMIEGTLEGFSFDSDDEGDKMPNVPAQQNDQNNEQGEQLGKMMKAKNEKSLGVTRKRAKTVTKPSKQGTRKSQAVKKTRKSKK